MTFSSCWFQPVWKNMLINGIISPRIGVKNNKKSWNQNQICLFETPSHLVVKNQLGGFISPFHQQLVKWWNETTDRWCVTLVFDRSFPPAKPSDRPCASHQRFKHHGCEAAEKGWPQKQQKKQQKNVARQCKTPKFEEILLDIFSIVKEFFFHCLSILSLKIT